MKKLNEKEEQIMQIIWRMEKAFVREIMEELDDPQVPVTTISSLVRKLETDGWLDHEAFGKTHRYFPLISMEAYRKASVSQIKEHYFAGSTAQLLSYFLREEKTDLSEIERLLEEIKKSESKGR
jgi:predicted transcriptional regulator